VHIDIDAGAVKVLRAYVDDMELASHAAAAARDSSPASYGGGGGLKQLGLGGLSEKETVPPTVAVAGFKGGIEEIHAFLEGVALVMQVVAENGTGFGGFGG
jgi:hypothetical protein